MLVHRQNIQQYIPQRPPMVMVHELLEASEHHAVTRFAVERGNIFLEDDQLTAPGLVENIAQTAATHLGFQHQVNEAGAPLGYIAAVRDLLVHRLPSVGTVIATTVQITHRIADVIVATGAVEADGELCCSCEMKIFIKKDQS